MQEAENLPSDEDRTTPTRHRRHLAGQTSPSGGDKPGTVPVPGGRAADCFATNIPAGYSRLRTAGPRRSCMIAGHCGTQASGFVGAAAAGACRSRWATHWSHGRAGRPPLQSHALWGNRCTSSPVGRRRGQAPGGHLNAQSWTGPDGPPPQSHAQWADYCTLADGPGSSPSGTGRDWSGRPAACCWLMAVARGPVGTTASGRHLGSRVGGYFWDVSCRPVRSDTRANWAAARQATRANGRRQRPIRPPFRRSGESPAVKKSKQDS